MIVVSYEKQLREAFKAGRAAGAAPFIRTKLGRDAWRVPETYEEWIASISDRPAVVRG